jgi:hypothetical protein
MGRLTIGRMIRKKIWISLAPSERAASRISVEIDLMAADRMTVANQIPAQMPT